MTLACASRKELTLQTALAQGLTEESATCQKKEAVYLNYNRIDKRNCNIAKTLCARDYKGLGTGFDTINGVVEKMEEVNKDKKPVLIGVFEGHTWGGESTAYDCINEREKPGQS